EIGYNSRLDELQAALLRVQLPHLDAWAAARRAAARAYAEAGLGDLVALPAPADGARPAWHLYVVRDERAEELADGLRARGGECRAYYRVPVHRQRAMRALAADADLPGTDEAARTHLALPMSAALGRAQVEAVVGAG